MKSIKTLVRDINHVVEREGWLTEANVERLTGELRSQLVQRGRQTDERTLLSLSKMGEKCPCHLWHSVHSPGLQEPLPAAARIKFIYGDVIEALVISMAKAAGHEVTGEQDELIVDGIKGHRDCVIDGCVVDVKSASSMAFQKFKTGTIRVDDPFGYLAQLDGYVVGSLDDPLVRVKDRGYLLAVDKQLGHIALYEHIARPDFIRERIATYKEIVARDTPPACTCGVVPEGKSGNYKLDVRASYNPYKHLCAERRNERIRTFLYASGPVFLTKVVRVPNVPEIDTQGKLVYNNGY